jgi:transposase
LPPPWKAITTVMATLIMNAKINDIDPQACLADVLARINNHAIHRLDELLK